MREWSTAKTQALLWLGHKLQLPINFDLRELLREIEVNGSRNLYRTVWIRKQGTKKFRSLNIPCESLRKVQQKIGRLIQAEFGRHPNSYGFVGGNPFEMLKAHLDSKYLLAWDVKNAFPSIEPGAVWIELRTKFGENVTRMIMYLCLMTKAVNLPDEEDSKIAFHCGLPQGSPASPALFEMVVRKLDEKLAKHSSNNETIVTRYADNFFLSSQKPLNKGSRWYFRTTERAGFRIHKIRHSDMINPIPALGYNLQTGCISNTKALRASLKMAIYNLEKTAGGKLDIENEIARLRGLLGFMSPASMPDSLRLKALTTLAALS